MNKKKSSFPITDTLRKRNAVKIQKYPKERTKELTMLMIITIMSIVFFLKQMK